MPRTPRASVLSSTLARTRTRVGIGTAGEYFYNDAIFPQNTGKIVVY
ncbi:hypothetical protein ACIBO5_24915 [Nonomuraea angiospora]